MTVESPYKSVDELVFLSAHITNELSPEGGGSESLPFPKEKDSKLYVVRFYYKAFNRLHAPIPGKATIKLYPPHKILAQDPSTGEVMNVIDCTPKDFGISLPAGQPIDVSVIDFKPNPESSFWKQDDRFKEISPWIWRLYSPGKPGYTSEDRELIREYSMLFFAIEKTQLVPYYKALSPDFFNWLEETSR